MEKNLDERSSRQRKRKHTSVKRVKTNRNDSVRRLRCEFLEDRRLLAVVTVDTVDDVVDISDGVTSLREAIFATNLVPGADEIVFDFGFDGPATILLEQGELQITDALTITGDGQALLTIDAQQQSRIFSIDESATQDELFDVTLVGLTLTGGMATNMEPFSVSRVGGGGAIRSMTNGNLSLNQSTVSGNITTGDRAAGGGIYSKGSVLLTETTVRSNSTTGRNSYGGGIVALYGDLTIIKSLIAENSTEGFESSGGGVYSWMGDVTLIESTVSDNSTTSWGGRGGGIGALHGNVSLIQSVVTGNTTSNGGAEGGGVFTRGTVLLENSAVVENRIEGRNGRGGGISALNVIAVGSTIRDNSAIGAGEGGGGIYASNSVELFESTITGNSTLGYGAYGGGIRAGGIVELTESAVSENSTAGSHAAGGGVSAGEVILISSQIKGNRTSGRNGHGGGIDAVKLVANDSTISDNWSSGETAHGGGIIGVEVLLHGSTVSGNYTEGLGSDGGGIFTRTVTLTNSTATNNYTLGTGAIGGGVSAEFVWLDHSIVAGNYDTDGLANEISGAIDHGYSLIGIGAEFLAPLADNGGLTFTHALLPGSPAINAGDLNAVPGENGVPAYDQRGDSFQRIVSRIDIGAYEVQEPSDMNLLVDTLLDESDGDFSRGDLSLREAIELANANPVPDTIRFDPAILYVPARPAIVLTHGELAIRDDLRIHGLGQDRLTIDAQGNDPTPEEHLGDGSRIFRIDDGDADGEIDVVISNLTLTGGDVAGGGGAIYSRESLRLDHVNVAENYAADVGGGLLLFGRTELSHLNVDGNQAGNRGGGIRVDGSSGVTIRDSTITGNSTVVAGGGVSTYRGAKLEVLDSRVLGNIATYRGGGLEAFSGTTTIRRTVFSGNSAMWGGGVKLNHGSALIEDSNISQNQASGGGGIFSERVNKLLLRNTKIAANRAFSEDAAGGGLYAERSVVHIEGGRLLSNATSGMGGGMRAIASSVWTNDVLFQSNRSFVAGGAISVARSALEVDGGEFSNNSVLRGHAGGAIEQSLGGTKITGTLFVANHLTGEEGFGGAIVVAGDRRVGRLEITDSEFRNNLAMQGGAIAVLSDGRATISRSTFEQNQTIRPIGNGGAIVTFAGSEVIVSESVFTQNVAGARGGAISSEGSLVVDRSLLSNNAAEGEGGGIAVSLDSADLVQIQASTIADNYASLGGGVFIFNRGGLFELTNSVVAENRQGGIYFRVPVDVLAAGQGSAESAESPQNRIQHSTIANNSGDASEGIGDGITIYGSHLGLSHSIVFANPQSSDSSDLLAGNLGGEMITAEHSMIGSVAPGTPMVVTSSTLGVDPRITSLSVRYGARLPSGVILPGIGLRIDSPAIDAGDPQLQQGMPALPEFDHRGAPLARVVSQRIDIGAFELQPSAGVFDGDLDNDGDTDGRDFLTWQQNFGSIALPTKADGDATGNGAVDGNDLAVWEATYLKRPGRRSAQAPQAPSAITAEFADLALASQLLVASASAAELATDDVGRYELSQLADGDRAICEFGGELFSASQPMTSTDVTVDPQPSLRESGPHSVEQANDEIFSRF